MTHSITLEQAKQMTARYRAEKDNIVKDEFRSSLNFSETFDAESFRTLLAQDGCKSLRIYFGMNENLNVRLIAVGVNATDKEMLQGEILEDGTPCPPVCPPPEPEVSLGY